MNTDYLRKRVIAHQNHNGQESKPANRDNDKDFIKEVEVPTKRSRLDLLVESMKNVSVASSHRRRPRQQIHSAPASVVKGHVVSAFADSRNYRMPVVETSQSTTDDSNAKMASPASTKIDASAVSELATTLSFASMQHAIQVLAKCSSPLQMEQQLQQVLSTQEMMVIKKVLAKNLSVSAAHTVTTTDTPSVPNYMSSYQYVQAPSSSLPSASVLPTALNAAAATSWPQVAGNAWLRITGLNSAWPTPAPAWPGSSAWGGMANSMWLQQPGQACAGMGGGQSIWPAASFSMPRNSPWTVASESLRQVGLQHGQGSTGPCLWPTQEFGLQPGLGWMTGASGLSSVAWPQQHSALSSHLWPAGVNNSFQVGNVHPPAFANLTTAIQFADLALPNPAAQPFSHTTSNNALQMIRR